MGGDILGGRDSSTMGNTLDTLHTPRAAGRDNKGGDTASRDNWHRFTLPCNRRGDNKRSDTAGHDNWHILTLPSSYQVG